MSLRSLLFPKRPDAASVKARKAGPDARNSEPPASARRQERSARREQLQALLREQMLAEGVLSSAYRFRALSLDGHGRRFMVMLDLLPGVAGPAQPAALERRLADAARERHGIELAGIYWRSVPQGSEAPSSDLPE